MRFDRRRDPLDAAQTQDGISLRALSSMGPVLLLFPRPIGTASCRAWLSALAAARAEIESRGVRPAIVHQAPEPVATAAFARFGLEYVARIADPEGALLDRFGLGRGTGKGRPGFRDWIARRRGVLFGDESRAAGLFLVAGGEVRAEFRQPRPGGPPPLLDFAKG